MRPWGASGSGSEAVPGTAQFQVRTRGAMFQFSRLLEHYAPSVGRHCPTGRGEAAVQASPKGRMVLSKA
eukprot:1667518-Alexandrium_andersonii.AAC.1